MMVVVYWCWKLCFRSQKSTWFRIGDCSLEKKKTKSIILLYANIASDKKIITS